MKYSHSEIQEASKDWIILPGYNSIVDPIREWLKAGNTFNVDEFFAAVEFLDENNHNEAAFVEFRHDKENYEGAI
jgi:hypothetical protein